MNKQIYGSFKIVEDVERMAQSALMCPFPHALPYTSLPHGCYLGNITNNETNWHHVPPDELHGQGHSITNVIFLTKMHKLKLTLKKIR